MGPAEKHNMSYQSPIFPFLPAQRLSISLQLSIIWNTGRDKALWSYGSDGRTSSPAASGTHTHTHTDKGRQEINISKRSSTADFSKECSYTFVQHLLPHGAEEMPTLQAHDGSKMGKTPKLALKVKHMLVLVQPILKVHDLKSQKITTFLFSELQD